MHRMSVALELAVALGLLAVSYSCNQPMAPITSANDKTDAPTAATTTAPVVAPNEPAGFAVETDWPYSAFSGAGWDGEQTTGSSVVSDPTAPITPPNVGEWTTGYTGPSHAFKNGREFHVSLWS